MHPILKNALRSCFALALFFWLVTSGRLEFSRFLSLNLGPPFFGVFAGLLIMMTITLRRWQILLRPHRVYLSFADTLHLGFMGYFANIFVPSSLGIETIRFYYLSTSKHLSVNKSAIISSIIMDRTTGLFALLIVAPLAASFLIWTGNNQDEIKLLLRFSVGLLLALVVGMSLVFSRRLFGRIPFLKKIAIVANFVSAMQCYRQYPLILAKALGLSLVGHASAFFAAYCGFLAFGDSIDPWIVFCVMPFVILGQALPLTPMGLGITETIGSELFSYFKITSGAEIVMLLRGATFIFSALGAFAYFKTFRPEKSADANSVAH